jgi:hypothetical protein
MSKKLTIRHRSRLLFDVFLIIVALIFFFNSLDLDFRAWLFPGCFSIILLIMVMIQTLIDWKQARKLPEIEGYILPETADPTPGELKKASLEGQYARLGIAVLSILGFYLIFRYATIYLAIPVLCVLLLCYLGGRSWRTVGILALCLDAFIFVFFQWLLQTSL